MRHEEVGIDLFPELSKRRSGWLLGAAVLVVLASGMLLLDGLAIRSIDPEGVSSKEGSLPTITPALLEDAYQSIPPGFKPPRELYSTTYTRQGQSMTAEQRQTMIDRWGAWTLEDTKERPGRDLYEKFPNRDVPRSSFPANAWQVDAEFLEEWFPQAEGLVVRAIEAILAEYGHSPEEDPGMTMDERADMFLLTHFDDGPPNQKFFTNGGWSNTKSADGLARRMLHAIMAQDKFTLVMGGHSSSAGHGNHFRQSYTMTIHQILSPVFARLGVYFNVHNFGFGGLGTIQNALASGSLYGDEIDLLMWDSGMTEGGAQDQDIFVRQAFLAGQRMPVIWGSGNRPQLLWWHENTGIEVAELIGYKSGERGLRETVDMVQVNDVPWAVRFMNCGPAVRSECKALRYNTTCWIPRDDVQPPVEQIKLVKGRAGWHPGNREHLLEGRILAVNILYATLKAIRTWKETDGYAIEDSAWHMTGHYENIKEKLAAIISSKSGACYDTKLPSRVCDLPMQGRSEYSPRYNPRETSIRSLIKEDCVIPEEEPNLYDPPDATNPLLLIPDGHVDVVNIVESGVPYNSTELERYYTLQTRVGKRRIRRNSVTSGLEPGHGWRPNLQSNPDTCDGTYFSFCGRANSSECLLSGHNDHRGSLLFDGDSGWMMFNIPALRNGLIVVHLLADLESLCPEFQFEFAIDGKIVSWSREEFSEHMLDIQRVVKMWTLLDDADFTAGEARDVELAIRQVGCGDEHHISLNHVYWS